MSLPIHFAFIFYNNSPSMYIAVASGERSCVTLAGFHGSRAPLTNTTLDIGSLRPENI